MSAYRQKSVDFVVFGLFLALTLYNGIRLYNSFPDTYVWSELMLNYQGGVVKRALLGEIAFQLDRGGVPASVFLTGVVVLLWIAVIWCLVFVFRLQDRFAGLLLLVSPAGAMFPFLDFDAFGRKDVIVILAVVLALIALERVRDARRCLALVYAIFLVAGPFTEVVFFYFPFVFWTFLLMRRDLGGRFRFGAAVVSAVFVLGCLLANYHFSSADEQAIAVSWRAAYPSVYVADDGALCCLTWDFAHVARHVITSMGGHLPRDTYLPGFILALLPIAFLLPVKEARPRTLLERLAMIGALVAAIGPMVLAIDWGRFISMLTMFLFLCLWVVKFGTAAAGIASGQLPAGPDARLTSRPRAAMLLLLVFALSWRMLHYAAPGYSGVVSGPLISWAWSPEVFKYRP